MIKSGTHGINRRVHILLIDEKGQYYKKCNPKIKIDKNEIRLQNEKVDCSRCNKEYFNYFTYMKGLND